MVTLILIVFCAAFIFLGILAQELLHFTPLAVLFYLYAAICLIGSVWVEACDRGSSR